MTFFSCRLITTPTFRRRLSSVLSKFSHNFFLSHSGVTPCMVSLGVVCLPSQVTELLQKRTKHNLLVHPVTGCNNPGVFQLKLALLHCRVVGGATTESNASVTERRVGRRQCTDRSQFRPHHDDGWATETRRRRFIVNTCRARLIRRTRQQTVAGLSSRTHSASDKWPLWRAGLLDSPGTHSRRPRSTWDARRTNVWLTSSRRRQQLSTTGVSWRRTSLHIPWQEGTYSTSRPAKDERYGRGTSIIGLFSISLMKVRYTKPVCWDNQPINQSIFVY